MTEEFIKDLEELLNKHSMDNYAHTPDFILAEVLAQSITNLKVTIENRERWFGRDVKTSIANTVLETPKEKVE